MDEFEKFIEEVFTKHPDLISDPQIRKLEDAVRAKITRWKEIMDNAGIV